MQRKPHHWHEFSEWQILNEKIDLAEIRTADVIHDLSWRLRPLDHRGRLVSKSNTIDFDKKVNMYSFK